MINTDNNKIVYKFDAETLLVEAWGNNALRVRATKNATFPDENWALTEEVKPVNVECCMQGEGAVIKNGKITGTVLKNGKLIISNANGKTLLEEIWRDRRDVTDPSTSALEIEGREFRPNIGGDYHLTYRIKSLSNKEKL